MEFQVKPARGGVGVRWHLIDSENGKILASSQVYRRGKVCALEAARSVRIEAPAASIWDLTGDPPVRVSAGLGGLAATRGRARPRGHA
jgi:hypothetical protein